MTYGPKLKHGERRINGKKSPTYSCWTAMRTRCGTQKDYKNIKCCKRWDNYLDFKQDMGERPSKNHTLSRLNHNKNYEPGNVIWESRSKHSAQIHNGHFKSNENHPNCKLRNGEVWLIKRIGNIVPQSYLGKMFKTSQSNIHKILTGKQRT